MSFPQNFRFRPMCSQLLLVLLVVYGKYISSSFTYSQAVNYSPIIRSAHNSSGEFGVIGMSFHSDDEKKHIFQADDGRWQAIENLKVHIILYGEFTHNMILKLTNQASCEDKRGHKSSYVHLITDDSLKMAHGIISIPKKQSIDDAQANHYQLCLAKKEKNDNTQKIHWELQDDHNRKWLCIVVFGSAIPIYIHISLIIVLLLLSGLFSGLNLGLMSLNKTDLKIIVNTGTVKEKKHATEITPVRNHGNFLLCVLLFSNVLVNSTLTIIMDELTTGVLAVIMSTLGIVIFGEILPQALCSRYGLAVGAKTIAITKFFMFITFPLAYPVSKILDYILGEEIGSIYTRERLKELLKVTKDYHGLANEEVGIISGALDMQRKTVKDIMTKIDKVFMVSIDAIMDFDTMEEINYHGFSRIPIYDRERSNIVALLNVKQLTLLDPSDNIPLHTVIEYYHNPLFFVFENTRLDYMFRAFREGSRGHMAFVQKVNDEGPGEPFCETIGIVTMEDVLEELLQAEIMDENDVGKLEDKLRHQKRPKYTIGTTKTPRVRSATFIDQTLALAAVQFLNTSVEPFKPEFISVPVLERIVKATACEVKVPKVSVRSDKNLPIYLYEFGKPSEYFVLILEGRVQIKVGHDKLSFEGGPFTTFGVPFLMENTTEIDDLKQHLAETTTKTAKKTFLPDYSVQVSTDIHFIKLKYNTYRAARLASELEKNYRDPKKAGANKNWEDDIDKILQQAFKDNSLD